MMENVSDATPVDARAEPLVTIVMTTYNHARFIVDAIDGVLSQTYSPLDIIILDDASSDGTGDVIAAELTRHPRRQDFRFIRNETNRGGRANVIAGIALARGKFIIGTCGDDVMLPTMAEKMVDVWRREDVSLVTVNATYIDEDSKQLNRFFRNPTEPYDETFETLARDGGNAVCFGAAMGVERKLLDQFGFPPEYLTGADIMLPFYAYLHKGARFISEPLLKYRVHQRNSSLSLRAEACSGIEKLVLHEQMIVTHLIHAFEMDAELDRFNEADASRYSDIARRIKPLLAVQAIEMGRKLVSARIELSKLGVNKLAVPLS
jgi:glycosyltransferase involved in cell wall biosynthesis